MTTKAKGVDELLREAGIDMGMRGKSLSAAFAVPLHTQQEGGLSQEAEAKTSSDGSKEVGSLELKDWSVHACRGGYGRGERVW